MEKHTRGPWYIVPSDHTVIVDGDPSQEGTRIVARVWDVRWASRNVYESDYREGIANARLIAEAPAMYEALKILVSWAKGNNLIGMRNEPPGIDEAMEVLARIEG